MEEDSRWGEADAGDDDAFVNEEFVLHLLRSILDPAAVLREKASAPTTSAPTIEHIVLGPSSSQQNSASTLLATQIEAASTLWDMASSPAVALFLHQRQVLVVLERVLLMHPPPESAAHPNAAATLRLLECVCGMVANLLSVCPAVNVSLAQTALECSSAAASASAADRTPSFCELLLGLLFTTTDASVLCEVCRSLHAALCADYFSGSEAAEETKKLSVPLPASASTSATASKTLTFDSAQALQSHCRSGWLSLFDRAIHARLFALFANTLHAALFERVACVVEDIQMYADATTRHWWWWWKDTDSATATSSSSPSSTAMSPAPSSVANSTSGKEQSLVSVLLEAVCDVCEHTRFALPKLLVVPRRATGSAGHKPSSTNNSSTAMNIASDSKQPQSQPPAQRISTAHYSDEVVRGVECCVRVLSQLTGSWSELARVVPRARLMHWFQQPVLCTALLEGHLIRGTERPVLQTVVAELLPNVLHLLLPAITLEAASSSSSSSLSTEACARERLRAPSLLALIRLYMSQRIEPTLTLYLAHALLAPATQRVAARLKSTTASASASAAASAASSTAASFEKSLLDSDVATIKVGLNQSKVLIDECVPHALRSASSEPATATAASAPAPISKSELSDADSGFCALWFDFLSVNGAALQHTLLLPNPDSVLAMLRAIKLK